MFSNSQKAVLMVNSPSLKTTSQEEVGSGWVSLPLDAKSKASKSFVGSVDREERIISEEKKETRPVSVIQGVVRGAMVAKGVVLPVRFYGPVVAVSYSSGSVAAVKTAWNPLAIGEFATFADLFSEYKLKRVVSTVWFTQPNQTSTNGPPDEFIIGSDPGSVTSGTPTSAISNLSGSQRWNTVQTGKSAPIFGADARKAPISPISSDGYVSIVTAWSGQTCMFATTASDGFSGVAYTYQTAYDLEFRCRY